MAKIRSELLFNRGITLYEQLQDIVRKFPFLKCRLKKNRLCCVGTFKSSLSGSEYEVKIIKQGNNPPRVKIIKPSIRKKHVYPDGSLCFYHYKNFKWDNNYLISDYHIPWTSAWIYFYEVWLITDEWVADEVSHENDPKSQKSK